MVHCQLSSHRQGNDVGTQYRSAIFYFNQEQKETAERVVKEVAEMKVYKRPIMTEVSPASDFYVAEEYHQLYLDKNPGGYCNHHIRWK